MQRLLGHGHFARVNVAIWQFKAELIGQGLED